MFRIKWHSAISKTNGYVLDNKNADRLNSKVEFNTENEANDFVAELKKTASRTIGFEVVEEK